VEDLIPRGGCSKRSALCKQSLQCRGDSGETAREDTRIVHRGTWDVGAYRPTWCFDT